MKIKIKKVYYCDFCSKHLLTSNSIKNHEKKCTLNPDRECGVCEDSICKDKKRYNEIIKKLKDNSSLKSKEADKFIDSIASKIECPACILSVMRQADVKYGFYDYKKAMEEYWKEKNAEEQEIY